MFLFVLSHIAEKELSGGSTGLGHIIIKTYLMRVIAFAALVVIVSVPLTVCAILCAKGKEPKKPKNQ